MNVEYIIIIIGGTKMKKKSLLAVLALLLVFMLLFAGCNNAAPAGSDNSGGNQQSQGGDGKYKIALSNSFIGNDWRQNMQAVAEMVAADPYYADRVQLDIINCEHTPEAQTASIDSITEMGYDAILVDACSTTGIDNALKRAQDAGLKVVVFDQIVESDEFVKMECDWEYVGETCAKFIAETCGGKGNYVMDRGQSGAATAEILYDTCVNYLKENTDMVLVAEFESEYAEGPAEQGVTAAMTANSQIDAVFSQGYVACIARAFRNADKKIPVITGGGSNGTGIDVLENGDYTCLQWDCNLAGMGAMAMEQAIQMLEGNEPAEKHIVLQDAQFKSTNPELGEKIGVELIEYKDGENVFKDYSAGFSWPVLPEDFPVQIKVEDLVERQKDFS